MVAAFNLINIYTSALFFICPSHSVAEALLVNLTTSSKGLSMIWRHWHISVSQLCCWSMAVSFWVASITVCVLWCAAARMSEL